MMIELRPDLGGEIGAVPPSAGLCRLLALSGGGYRGLFTARVLSCLEDQARRSAVEIFDLIVGTSTGALIGAALSLKVPARSIEKAYLERGPLIFSAQSGWRATRSMRRFFLSAPYEPSALYAVIRELIGDEVARTPLRDLNIPFVATAVSHTREQIRLFGGGRFARISDQISIEDAIVASAAAPTYFPSKQYMGESLVDGGLVANAPELIAVAAAKSELGVAMEEIRLLAIGTASPSEGLRALSFDRRGIVRWLLSKRGLVRLTMSAQEHLARQLTKQLLNENYVIIDKPPGADQAALLMEMDNTTKSATDTLLVLAEMAWSDFISDSRHRIFL